MGVANICACSRHDKYRFKNYITSVYPDDVHCGPNEDALDKLISYISSNPERVPHVCRKIAKLATVQVNRGQCARVMITVHILRTLIKKAHDVDNYVAHSIEVCALLLHKSRRPRYWIGAASILVMLCHRLSNGSHYESSRRLVADNKNVLLPMLIYMCRCGDTVISKAKKSMSKPTASTLNTTVNNTTGITISNTNTWAKKDENNTSSKKSATCDTSASAAGRPISSSLSSLPCSSIQLRYAAVLALGHLVRCLHATLGEDVMCVSVVVLRGFIQHLRTYAWSDDAVWQCTTIWQSNCLPCSINDTICNNTDASNCMHAHRIDDTNNGNSCNKDDQETRSWSHLWAQVRRRPAIAIDLPCDAAAASAQSRALVEADIFALGAAAGCVTATNVSHYLSAIFDCLSELQAWSVRVMPVLLFETLVSALNDRPQPLGYVVYDALCQLQRGMRGYGVCVGCTESAVNNSSSTRLVIDSTHAHEHSKNSKKKSRHGVCGRSTADTCPGTCADYATISVGVLRALTACVSVMRMSGRRPRHVLTSLRALLRMCGGVFPVTAGNVCDTAPAAAARSNSTFDEAVLTLVDLCAVLCRSTTLHGEATELLFLLTALQKMLLRVQYAESDDYKNSNQHHNSKNTMDSACDKDSVGHLSDSEDYSYHEDDDSNYMYPTLAEQDAIWPAWGDRLQQQRILLACIAVAAPYVRLISPAQRGKLSVFYTLHAFLYHDSCSLGSTSAAHADNAVKDDRADADMRTAAQAIHGALAGRVEWEWRREGASCQGTNSANNCYKKKDCEDNSNHTSSIMFFDNAYSVIRPHYTAGCDVSAALHWLRWLLTPSQAPSNTSITTTATSASTILHLQPPHAFSSSVVLTPHTIVEVAHVCTAVIACGGKLRVLPQLLAILYALQQYCLNEQLISCTCLTSCAATPLGSAGFTSLVGNAQDGVQSCASSASASAAVSVSPSTSLFTSPRSRALLQMISVVLMRCGDLCSLPELTRYASGVLASASAAVPTELADCFLTPTVTCSAASAAAILSENYSTASAHSSTALAAQAVAINDNQSKRTSRLVSQRLRMTFTDPVAMPSQASQSICGIKDLVQPSLCSRGCSDETKGLSSNRVCGAGSSEAKLSCDATVEQATNDTIPHLHDQQQQQQQQRECTLTNNNTSSDTTATKRSRAVSCASSTLKNTERCCCCSSVSCITDVQDAPHRAMTGCDYRCDLTPSIAASWIALSTTPSLPPVHCIVSFPRVCRLVTTEPDPALARALHVQHASKLSEALWTMLQCSHHESTVAATTATTNTTTTIHDSYNVISSYNQSLGRKDLANHDTRCNRVSIANSLRAQNPVTNMILADGCAPAVLDCLDLTHTVLTTAQKMAVLRHMYRVNPSYVKLPSSRERSIGDDDNGHNEVEKNVKEINSLCEANGPCVVGTAISPTTWRDLPLLMCRGSADRRGAGCNRFSTPLRKVRPRCDEGDEASEESFIQYCDVIRDGTPSRG